MSIYLLSLSLSLSLFAMILVKIEIFFNEKRRWSRRRMAVRLIVFLGVI